jgi:hypothetical protein
MTDDFEFSAERLEGNKVVFTIENSEICAKCALQMDKVIELNDFLNKEIESWLLGDD